jgi:hypothetical protein
MRDMIEEPVYGPEEFARRVNERLSSLKDHITVKSAKWFIEHGWTPQMVWNEFYEKEQDLMAQNSKDLS